MSNPKKSFQSIFTKWQSHQVERKHLTESIDSINRSIADINERSYSVLTPQEANDLINLHDLLELKNEQLPKNESELQEVEDILINWFKTIFDGKQVKVSILNPGNTLQPSVPGKAFLLEKENGITTIGFEKGLF